jgi:hypothetical protein
MTEDLGGDVRRRPERRASVAKSLRKSWGVKFSGLFEASVSPETARMWRRNWRRVVRDIARFSGPRGRWNRNGIGALQVRS